MQLNKSLLMCLLGCAALLAVSEARGRGGRGGRGGGGGGRGGDRVAERPVCQCADLDQCHEEQRAAKDAKRQQKEATKAECVAQCGGASSVNSVNLDALMQCREDGMEMKEERKALRQCVKKQLPKPCEGSSLTPLRKKRSPGGQKGGLKKLLSVIDASAHSDLVAHHTCVKDCMRQKRQENRGEGGGRQGRRGGSCFRQLQCSAPAGQRPSREDVEAAYALCNPNGPQSREERQAVKEAIMLAACDCAKNAGVIFANGMTCDQVIADLAAGSSDSSGDVRGRQRGGRGGRGGGRVPRQAEESSESDEGDYSDESSSEEGDY